MVFPQIMSRLWSYFVFLCSKRARLAGQSPDGREAVLLNFVLKNAEKGNPESVLSAIENFAQHTWLMNIGKQKSTILDGAVQRFDPKVALEHGTYCGYSAIRIASRMTKPDSKLVSIEMNPQNCSVARAIIEHAGLSLKVKVIEGTLDAKLEEVDGFLEEERVPYLDFIFMDHSNQCYLSDFLLLKERGMMGKGTGIVANSSAVGFAGASDFFDYLRSHPEELETGEHKCSVDPLSLPSTVTVSIYKADLPVFTH